MSPLNQKILQVVRLKPGLTARQLADLLAEGGVYTEDRTVYNHLTVMLKHGLVEKEKARLIVSSKAVIAKRRRTKGQSTLSVPQVRNSHVVVWKVAA